MPHVAQDPRARHAGHLSVKRTSIETVTLVGSPFTFPGSNSHCRNAYGHWSTYLRRSRDGDAEGAAQALFYYDAAARRSAALSGGK